MATAAPPQKVKLITGLLATEPAWLDCAREKLEKLYGPADIVSVIYDFYYTNYYQKQMGSGLKRQFLAFENLIDPGELAKIKLQTNELEETIAAELKSDIDRPVNIDPGYIHTAKLVLASAKDFAHRVYISGGIFAEVTLQYRGGKWESSPWTFPDYGSGDYDDFLNAARETYKTQQDTNK